MVVIIIARFFPVLLAAVLTSRFVTGFTVKLQFFCVQIMTIATLRFAEIVVLDLMAIVTDRSLLAVADHAITGTEGIGVQHVQWSARATLETGMAGCALAKRCAERSPDTAAIARIHFIPLFVMAGEAGGSDATFQVAAVAGSAVVAEGFVIAWSVVRLAVIFN